jgi:hypothetical protein
LFTLNQRFREKGASLLAGTAMLFRDHGVRAPRGTAATERERLRKEGDRKQKDRALGVLDGVGFTEENLCLLSQPVLDDALYWSSFGDLIGFVRDIVGRRVRVSGQEMIERFAAAKEAAESAGDGAAREVLANMQERDIQIAKDGAFLEWLQSVDGSVRDLAERAVGVELPREFVQQQRRAVKAMLLRQLNQRVVSECPDKVKQCKRDLKAAVSKWCEDEFDAAIIGRFPETENAILAALRSEVEAVLGRLRAEEISSFNFSELLQRCEVFVQGELERRVLAVSPRLGGRGELEECRRRLRAGIRQLIEACERKQQGEFPAGRDSNHEHPDAAPGREPPRAPPALADRDDRVILRRLERLEKQREEDRYTIAVLQSRLSLLENHNRLLEGGIECLRTSLAELSDCNQHAAESFKKRLAGTDANLAEAVRQITEGTSNQYRELQSRLESLTRQVEMPERGIAGGQAEHHRRDGQNPPQAAQPHRRDNSRQPGAPAIPRSHRSGEEWR